MIRLIVTESAKSDISQILDYLETEAGPATAARYSDDFREWFSALAVFPESGSPRPALGKSVRVGIIHPCLMLYEYASDAASVSLLRVLHGRRKVTRALLRRR